MHIYIFNSREIIGRQVQGQYMGTMSYQALGNSNLPLRVCNGTKLTLRLLLD